MGYTTYFDGSLKFNKPVEDWLVEYVNKFNKTRRMKRNNEKIKELFPDWKKHCFAGNLGEEGEYFIGGLGYYGQDSDGSVLDHNVPARTQPGLWCQWVIGDNNDELMWDEGEKFYDYVEWLEYMIDNFFAPLGYVLNGDISWEGEESDDVGVIHVEDNIVDVEYGVHVHSMSAIDTDDMIKELEKRGYKVTA
jgi:hypothetical protein